MLSYKVFILGMLASGLCSAQRYVLVPKETMFASVQDYRSFAEAHDLEEFATFDFGDKGELSMYTSDHKNVNKHRNILSRYYEIEEDVEIKLSYQHPFTMASSDEVPWHLQRVTQRHMSTTIDKYRYAMPGSCHMNNDVLIDTYIVDTGIDITHPQFEGRAVWGSNFVDTTDTDCNNHGTHVAGLVGSKDYGVCVDSNLIAVKVLDCAGSGSLSGVIKGIEYAYKSHLEKSGKSNKTVKSIINMSLGGGFSRALNKAVESCVENNRHFYIVVAAGNENSDSCKTSPASVRSILTVMASDKHDNRAWFSNWGECADIYAPGVDIESTIPGGKTDVYSGTSMASPVMAGVLNHYIDMFPKDNLRKLKKRIQQMSTTDIIVGDKPQTKNNLVFLERESESTKFFIQPAHIVYL